MGGHSLFLPQIAHVFLQLATCVLVYFLGNKSSQLTGRCAALIVALWPSMIGMSNLLATENLFVPLFLSSLYFIVYAPSVKGLTLSGILLGFSTLTRPITLLLPLAVGIVEVVRTRQIRSPLRGTVALMAGMMLVLAPWIYRNVVVLRSPVIVSTNGGVNLWIGVPPHATGGDVGIRISPELYAYWRWAALNEVQRDRDMYRLAWQGMTRYPLEYVLLIPKKLFHLFARDTWSVGWAQFHRLERFRPGWLKVALASVAQVYYLLALLLASVALLTHKFWRPLPSVIYVVIGYWIAMHVFYFGVDRFHIPILPLIAVLSSQGLITISRHRERTRHQEMTLARGEVEREQAMPGLPVRKGIHSEAWK
jgi:hypothetical protein